MKSLGSKPFCGNEPALCRFVLLHLLVASSLALEASGSKEFKGNVTINTAFERVEVHEGSTAILECFTSQTSKSSKPSKDDVYWSFGEERITIIDFPLEKRRVSTDQDADHYKLTIRSVKRDDEGSYRCVWEGFGQMQFAKIFLDVIGRPDPPKHVKVTSCHGNDAEIAWEAGADNGAPIESFSIQYNISDKPGVWYSFYEDVPGNEMTKFVTLPPYGTYSFRVLAHNAVGSSRPSGVTFRMCTTPPDQPDRNPTRVGTRTDKKGYLVIEWQPLSRLWFHGPGFGYIVLWRRKGSLAWTSAMANGSYASSFERKVKDVYAQYELKVKAVNKFGEAYQPPYIFLGRSFESEPKVTVSGFRMEAEVVKTTAHFVWNPVAPNDRKIFGKFRGYKIIYWASNQEDDKKEFIAAHEKLPRASIPDLPAYSTIKFQVVVVNTHYQGPPCPPIDVMTPEGTPSAVLKPSAEFVRPTSVTIRWLAPAHHNGVLQGYDLILQPVEGSKLGSPQLVSQNNPHQHKKHIRGLQPNKWYRVHIMARTGAGRGQATYIDVRTPKRAASDTSVQFHLKEKGKGNKPEVEGANQRGDDWNNSSARLSHHKFLVWSLVSLASCFVSIGQISCLTRNVSFSRSRR